MKFIDYNDKELFINEHLFPKPSTNQLLVKVLASGINRADLLQRRGLYPPPPGASSILGLEIAGEVVECGDQVTQFTVGDRVCGIVAGGGYAEFCVIDVGSAIPIPDQMTYIEAAAIPEAFLTAQQALFAAGQLQADETVLIHAGASGVGSAAIQLAKQITDHIVVTAGSAEKLKFATALGANISINYKQQDFVSVTREQYSEGVDVIIDFVGASYLHQHLELLNTNGRLVMVGLLGGSKSELDLATILFKRLQIKGVAMRSQSNEVKQLITQQFIENWLPLFAQNKLQPIVDSTYSWDQAQDAHIKMHDNKNLGKLILYPE